ncbi:cytochrome b/b6 domain-containing protein [Microbacterium immunditiarum]|uniref:Thiosulfate reductase cytochrome b subunit n=1 Tax=Microbacterium immunditiarum TaxID=337480 RepID=A0A7Y9GLR4_9MICO|nr:cytochrome b/b6 domain-containing protein [Microbacterium immunditiarum]NYE18828.1 thiosulfate reductase cytochrome b subunit [Microbacterium immunditiarum]
MATYGRTLRRGLPRVAGGEPWPPNGDAPAGVVEVESAPAASAPAVAEAEAPSAPAAERAQRDEAPAAVETMVADAASPVAATGVVRRVRRGLPRLPGGEPWPPESALPSTPVAVHAEAPSAPVAARAQRDEAQAPTAATAPAAAAPAAATSTRPLRRGLPRTSGGEPWPPAGFAPDRTAAAASSRFARSAPGEESPALVASEAAAPATEVAPAPVAAVPAAPARPVRTGLPRPGAAPAAAPAAAAAPVAASAAPPAPAATAPRPPLPFTPTVWPGAAASVRPAPRPEPQRIGPFTKGQWAGAAIVGGLGLLFAAGMVVLFVRWLLSLDFMQDFLATYPGEYHLPEGAPVGLPPWLGWQHFFNVFLIVLIIRSGLRVRTEKRPTAFWSPRWNSKRKISLALWFHQSLDILWFVNGVVFVVLLFVTGQWMRIVPTSWEVFPNAVSAALQYVSLDWPTENGWVNYNSLQQLAYFTTVFIAAPLAAITGVRMSGVWPKDAAGLNKAYPVEWARAIHFPVMIYFVLFIFVHVVLVFATGALRNLNHMYASQDAVNWVGFWIFVASMIVIAAAWVAARPLVLAPIARLFGKVTAR